MDEFLTYPLIDEARLFDGKPLGFATRSLEGTLEVKGSGLTLNNGGRDLTLTEYRERMAEQGCKVRLVTQDTFNRLCEAYHEQLKTEPCRISGDAYEAARHYPYPEKWRHFGNVEVFHSPARISGNLVVWYARVNNASYHFIDDASLSPRTIRDRLLALHDAALTAL